MTSIKNIADLIADVNELLSHRYVSEETEVVIMTDKDLAYYGGMSVSSDDEEQGLDRVYINVVEYEG